MKKTTACFLIAVTSAFGVFSTASADLGLAQLNNAPAVGRAVMSAASAVYANNTDPAVIQQKLIVILNEAAATGNQAAMRYAIAGVMMAGGTAHLEQSITAINNSNLFSQYPELTAKTVGELKLLMGAGSKGGQASGGDKGLGGGNGKDKELGGGGRNVFTWESLTGPGDEDLPATGV